jgi:hypothetical protein
MKIILPFLYDYVFPNYILPNALITELGIINYIHSLNSNRLGPHSFFEQSIHTGRDGENLLTYMFGKSLGTFPNSTGGAGSHLSSKMYNEIVECVDESLYLGKKNYNKYIYPIRMSPHINDFCGVADFGSKLNGEFFWKHMSAEALQDARQGRAIIFLDFAQENFIERHAFEYLHDSIRRSGILPNKIVLAFNSFNAQELYESWFPPEQRFLEVRNWPFVICNTSYYYRSNPNSYVNPLKFVSSKMTIRDHHFLFKIRRPRPYRQALLFKLFEDNLLEKGDWSWLEKKQFDEHEVKSILSTYGIQSEANKFKELFSKFPHPLKDEPGGTFDTISSWTDMHSLSYQNAYFYICTETYTHGEYRSITEKVCKPMVNFMPFLFMSFPGALEVLKGLGFRTFSPFIDESYDRETSGTLRFQMICNEVKRLCAMSKEEIHDWYWNMKDILMHNHNHLLKFYKEDKYTLELVNYLDNRIKP